MIRVSVKEIVGFVYQAGDLQSELSLGRDQLGIKLHQMIQQQYTDEDHAEVVVHTTVDVLGESFSVHGRIDGVRQSGQILEEIKSTTDDLDDLSFDAYPVHAAQAKIYAYLYLLTHPKPSIQIDLTYISVQTEQVETFSEAFTFEALEQFFFSTMEHFASWMLARAEHRSKVLAQTSTLSFPYAKREPQERFMKGIYQTLKQQGILYAIAPTGTGKTMGALFSGLKAKDPEDTLFYLTAKNSHKQLAMDSMAELSRQGLQAVSVQLTAKDHICFLEERDCDPEVCPFAKGYYDKIQGALRESLDTTHHFTREVIEELARAHEVCPFELSLDISTYADVVVCDYNYVFDPKARLIRYFEVERPVRLLIDEAHNLVSRSKSMYSAVLQAAELRPLLATPLPKPIHQSLEAIVTYLNQPSFDQPDLDPSFHQTVQRAFDRLSDYLLQQPKHPDRKVLLKGLFHLLDWRRIVNVANEAMHVIHSQPDQTIKLACLNASNHLIPMIQELKGTVLFSATLEPLSYYQAFLTQDHGKVLRVESPFDPSQVQTLLLDHLSVRYSDRSKTYPEIASYIHALCATTKNTIVFAPSYEYIRQLTGYLPDHAILQDRDWSLAERDAVVLRFQQETGVLGVFVVGGVFAEGVDYIGPMLEQLMIIGVGMPGVDIETNKTKAYFDQMGAHGFDYAYRYPGISKIIQAAGRLIRTASDRGILLLVDDRYQESFYQSALPRLYGTPKRIRTIDDLEQTIQWFWQNKGMS
jgi:DNA excision repair protein ERCC-2